MRRRVTKFNYWPCSFQLRLSLFLSFSLIARQAVAVATTDLPLDAAATLLHLPASRPLGFGSTESALSPSFPGNPSPKHGSRRAVLPPIEPAAALRAPDRSDSPHDHRHRQQMWRRQEKRKHPANSRALPPARNLHQCQRPPRNAKRVVPGGGTPSAAVGAGVGEPPQLRSGHEGVSWFCSVRQPLAAWGRHRNATNKGHDTRMRAFLSISNTQCSSNNKEFFTACKVNTVIT